MSCGHTSSSALGFCFVTSPVAAGKEHKKKKRDKARKTRKSDQAHHGGHMSFCALNFGLNFGL